MVGGEPIILSYLISAHGVIEEDSGKINDKFFGKIRVITYVDDHTPLEMSCGYALQTYLVGYRNKQDAFPICDPPIKIIGRSSDMPNVHLYTTRNDSFNSGILDITSYSSELLTAQPDTKPSRRVIRDFNNPPISDRFTLNDALEIILNDSIEFINTLSHKPDYLIEVHLLTCL